MNSQHKAPVNSDIKHVTCDRRHLFAFKATPSPRLPRLPLLIRLLAARRLRASLAGVAALAFGNVALAQVTPLGPPGPALSPALQAQIAKDFTRLQEIEARATRVAAVNDLRNLQGIFGYYFD